MRFEGDRHPFATTKANRQLHRLIDGFDEVEWSTLRRLRFYIFGVTAMTRDQSEGLSSGFSAGVTRRLNIWWTSPAPERWTPARPRRALVLRDFLPNRALVSSRARTCC